MSLLFMNQFSSIPLAERDQNQSHLAPFTLTSATSSCSCPILLNTTSQGQGANNRDHHLLQQEPKEHVFISKSSDHLVMTFPTKSNNNNNTMEESSRENPCVSHEDLHGPSNWMSSKMRFMRKMMNYSDHVSKPRRNIHILQDQVQPNQDRSTSSGSNSLNGGIIRVCSDCNTTKTPLWRSGPLGPKSLCNACGIRQRKARRAMDTAAASGGISSRETPSKVRKEKKSDVDRTLPFKKRCKIATAAAAQKNPCFDDVLIRLGNSSSAVHRVFPQDERDAALLLMALSWGIICS